MATNTTNYNLVKPSENEYYDINVSNSNLDIIDTEIKKVNDRLDSVSTDAQSTSFDNSSNGMEATNVQDAIEENKTSILSLEKQLGGQIARAKMLLTSLSSKVE